MPTYVWRNGGLVEKRETKHVGLQIVPDIDPFISPIDQSIVGSRSAIRDHEKRHSVRQCGNDYTGSAPPSWWEGRNQG